MFSVCSRIDRGKHTRPDTDQIKQKVSQGMKNWPLKNFRSNDKIRDLKKIETQNLYF